MDDKILERHDTSSNLAVQFQAAGDIDMIEISIRDTKDIVHREATEADRERWPREWSAFEAARQRSPETGTPLTAIPGMTRDRQIALRVKGVKNAEALAAMDDYAAVSLGADGPALAQIARLVINAAKPQLVKKAA